MSTLNTQNSQYANAADGFTLGGGTTVRTMTFTGANMTFTGSGTNVYTFPASTSTLASLTLAETFTNKTLTSPIISSSVTATVGMLERDASAFYSTPVTGARGVSPSIMYSIIASGDFTLATTSGVQAAFASTGDVWTLAGSTSYFFEGLYHITKTTSSVTTAMAFALAGGASVTSIRYFTTSNNAAANTTTTASNATMVDTVSSTVVTAATTGATSIRFQGIIRMNAGGTVTPQVSWSANTTVPVMKASSYIKFYPIGTNTNNTLGSVA